MIRRTGHPPLPIPWSVEGRFPSPWSVEDIGAAFVVTDSPGQKLAFNTTARSRRHLGRMVIAVSSSFRSESMWSHQWHPERRLRREV
jgi:hypothetical protein